MIHSIFIVAFALLSLFGAVSYYFHHNKISCKKHASLLFFSFSHLCFFLVGLSGFFFRVSSDAFFGCIILIFLSRIVNGRVLFQKNNWQHYAVNITMMLFISALYMWCI